VSVSVRLMDTVWADTDGVHDDLLEPADVDAWLDAAGLDRRGVPATPAELVHARALRDAARRLAAHVTGDDRPAAVSAMSDIDEAVRTVDVAAAERPAPELRLVDGVLVLAAADPQSPVAAALAEVADDARHLLTERATQLRACHAPGCVLYFVRTHPRREWCSVACGNRVRAARHYDAIRKSR
jgi:predicted RNA-binding Zn ribbon-like protein